MTSNIHNTGPIARCNLAQHQSLSPCKQGFWHLQSGMARHDQHTPQAVGVVCPVHGLLGGLTGSCRLWGTVGSIASPAGQQQQGCMHSSSQASLREG